MLAIFVLGLDQKCQRRNEAVLDATGAMCADSLHVLNPDSSSGQARRRCVWFFWWLAVLVQRWNRKFRPIFV